MEGMACRGRREGWPAGGDGRGSICKAIHIMCACDTPSDVPAHHPTHPYAQRAHKGTCADAEQGWREGNENSCDDRPQKIIRQLCRPPAGLRAPTNADSYELKQIPGKPSRLQQELEQNAGNHPRSRRVAAILSGPAPARNSSKTTGKSSKLQPTCGLA